MRTDYNSGSFEAESEEVDPGYQRDWTWYCPVQ